MLLSPSAPESPGLSHRRLSSVAYWFEAVKSLGVFDIEAAVAVALS